MGQEKKHKVMIVDADMLHVIEVEGELLGQGFDVVSLTTPNGVFAQLEYENPDVLLVDIAMEGLNTHDLFEAIRCSEMFENLIIIITSEKSGKEMDDVCNKSELNGYFSKQMDVGHLHRFIKRFFQ